MSVNLWSNWINCSENVCFTLHRATIDGEVNRPINSHQVRSWCAYLSETVKRRKSRNRASAKCSRLWCSERNSSWRKEASWRVELSMLHEAFAFLFFQSHNCTISAGLACAMTVVLLRASCESCNRESASEAKRATPSDYYITSLSRIDFQHMLQWIDCCGDYLSIHLGMTSDKKKVSMNKEAASQ